MALIEDITKLLHYQYHSLDETSCPQGDIGSKV